MNANRQKSISDNIRNYTNIYDSCMFSLCLGRELCNVVVTCARSHCMNAFDMLNLKYIEVTVNPKLKTINAINVDIIHTESNFL